MAGHGRHELADGNALGLYALAAEEVVAAATVAEAVVVDLVRSGQQSRVGTPNSPKTAK